MSDVVSLRVYGVPAPPNFGDGTPPISAGGGGGGKMSYERDVSMLKFVVYKIGGVVAVGLFGALLWADTKFDGVAQRFDAVGTRFDAVNARFDVVNTRFDGVDARLDDMSSRIDDMGSRIDDMGSRIDSVNSRVDALTQRMIEVSIGVSDLNRQGSEILSRLNSMTAASARGGD